MQLRPIRRQFMLLMDFATSRVVGLREAFWTYRRNPRQPGRSDQAFCWLQWVREGTHTRHIGSGRPLLSSRREYRFNCLQTTTASTVTMPII
ncbi:hypothetical protein NPIL_286291 [Nephila pilipes]|uniref:Uncharacterized protein n=1 Tax=Nephila pilipes TaxID=299642 RepID=A0A8X6QRC7_NEPPI|nr:hypothetical protein NPIL_286291 [Nephila pilipes]